MCQIPLCHIHTHWNIVANQAHTHTAVRLFNDSGLCKEGSAYQQTAKSAHKWLEEHHKEPKAITWCSNSPRFQSTHDIHDGKGLLLVAKILTHKGVIPSQIIFFHILTSQLSDIFYISVPSYKPWFILMVRVTSENWAFIFNSFLDIHSHSICPLAIFQKRKKILKTI